jgi:hypothetical protein
MERGIERRRWAGDVLAAGALALVLAVAWSARDWHDLSALRLPDTDDVMRLQQIRDWLAGQRFDDLAQHRLGFAPGLAMHWSRLADLVPGAIIAALTPLAGAHAAELTAVLVWPTLLFAAALTLTAGVARALGGDASARTAIVVAGVAYPATTIFLPGRIDHHGLQIVLLLVVLRALLARMSLRAGLVAGLATAASLVIGLETAPLLAAAGAVLAFDWVGARAEADDRMTGFGIGAVVGLLVAAIVFRSQQWFYPACDGFTAMAWRAEVMCAFAPLALAIAARGVARPSARAGVGVVIGGLLMAGALMVSPACLSPYGGVDPLLRRLWLGRVGEAQALFAAPAATAIGYAGVMVAGVVASVWAWARTRDRRWSVLLALQLAACVLTCWQLRGAYAGAMLAAPSLASGIAAARTRGAGWMAAAWLASAGMLYPIAAQALVPDHDGAAGGGRAGEPGCTSPEALALLAAQPAGRLLAPLDLGAYAIGATRLSVIGGPYHRNDAGNLAVYRAFLGTPDRAAAVVRARSVRYIALCTDSFAELPSTPRFAAYLRSGVVPPWLRVAGRRGALTLYAVVPDRLPARS